MQNHEHDLFRIASHIGPFAVGRCLGLLVKYNPNWCPDIDAFEVMQETNVVINSALPAAKRATDRMAGSPVVDGNGNLLVYVEVNGTKTCTTDGHWNCTCQAFRRMYAPYKWCSHLTRETGALLRPRFVPQGIVSAWGAENGLGPAVDELLDMVVEGEHIALCSGAGVRLARVIGGKAHDDLLHMLGEQGTKGLSFKVLSSRPKGSSGGSSTESASTTKPYITGRIVFKHNWGTDEDAEEQRQHEAEELLQQDVLEMVEHDLRPAAKRRKVNPVEHDETLVLGGSSWNVLSMSQI